jgi:hypothetical protein
MQYIIRYDKFRRSINAFSAISGKLVDSGLLSSRKVGKNSIKRTQENPDGSIIVRLVNRDHGFVSNELTINKKDLDISAKTKLSLEERIQLSIEENMEDTDGELDY